MQKEGRYTCQRDGASFVTLKNDPLCEMCLEEGIVTPADDVHHIVSFMSVTDKHSRTYLAYDYNNLKSLCKKHHQLVHNSKC